MNAAEFNSRYPVGTPVVAYRGCRPEDCPNDERLVTRTRSKAEVLGGHTDVVWVDGHDACIALSHVDVVTDAEPITDLATAVAVMGALPMPAGPASPKPRWQQARTELINMFRDYMPETARTKAVDLLDEVLLEATAEIQRLKRDLERRTEDLAFLERATLPELRRTVQHHQDGKKRWRDRAERAEARVRELEATSQPDETEYAVRMPGSNDVWPRREFRMGHWERVLREGGVLLERVIRRGPWTEAPNQCPGFEGNPVAPDQCAGCGETNDAHEEAGR